MDKIEELLTRGVANIIPGKEDLIKVLKNGKKLNIYLGIDPTATRIHLGHAVPLRKLQAFAELGHNMTFLIGDFTALVGDTSDKESERPILTPEEIKKNFQTYKKQAEKIVDFSKVKIRHNSEWLSKLTYEEGFKLKQQFSLNDFISRELIRKRLDTGKSVRLDETEYPLMQGYDSYHMNTDIQLGGTDQTFNMQAGRTLQNNLRNKESFIISNLFLDGTDGRKMSKSWGNAIWLDDNPNDMFAKIMAIKDELIIQYYTLATSTPMEQIHILQNNLKDGLHPMEAKKQLAFQIVSELHNKQDAESAKKHFENTVQDGQKPENILIMVHDDIKVEDFRIINVLPELNLAESKSDAKRLIEQGGVSINEEKITDPDFLVTEGLLKVGKRKFVKIIK